MILCNRCRNTMSEADLEENRDREMVCPICGSDDLSDAVLCQLCKKWTAEDKCQSYTSYLTLPPRNVNICADCTKRTLIEYNRIIKEKFDATEQLILAEEGLYGDIV